MSLSLVPDKEFLEWIRSVEIEAAILDHTLSVKKLPNVNQILRQCNNCFHMKYSMRRMGVADDATKTRSSSRLMRDSTVQLSQKHQDRNVGDGASQKSYASDVSAVVDGRTLFGCDFPMVSNNPTLLQHVEDLMVIEERSAVNVLLLEGSKIYNDMVTDSSDKANKVPHYHIEGLRYMQVPCVIEKNIHRDEIVSGTLDGGASGLKQLFKNGTGGISIGIEDRDYSFELPWRSYHNNESIVIFARSKIGMRTFAATLGNYKNEESLKLVFGALQKYVVGDQLQALKLAQMYYARLTQLMVPARLLAVSNHRMNINKRSQEMVQKDREKIEAELLGVLARENSFDTDAFKLVVSKIEDCFKEAINTCLTSWNVYKKPIMMSDAVDKCVTIFKEGLPLVWETFCRYRGLMKYQRRKHLMRMKERQVLFLFLAVCRTRNSRNLPSWAIVLTLSEHARGTSRVSQKVISYFGVSVSYSFVRSNILSFREIVKEKRTEMLKAEKWIMVVYDNTQIVTRLKYQRKGQSSQLLKGTVRFAKKIYPFDNIQYNAMKVEKISFVHQSIPSPPRFPKFIEPFLPIYITDFENIMKSVGPDFSGSLVNSYGSMLRIVKTLKSVKRVLSTTSDPPRDFLPQDMMNDSRRVVRHIARLSRTGILRAAEMFQSKVTASYSALAHCESEMIMFPISVHDETTVDGNGAVAVENCIDIGLLQGDFGGPWNLEPCWENRNVLMCGDALSISHYASFLKNIGMQRKQNYNDSYRQMKVLEQALSRFHPLPGDWHYGLNIMVVIFKLFYGGFIQAVQDLLKVKRLQEDPTTRYQLSLYILRIIHNQTERCLFEIFLGTYEACEELFENELCYSNYLSKIDDSPTQENRTDADSRVHKLACDFNDFVDDLTNGDDEVLQYLAYFHKYVNILEQLLFSVKYMDTIGIEIVYSTCLPIWRVMNSKRYFNLTLSFMEDYYAQKDYDVLMTMRMNKGVRLSERKSNSCYDYGIADDEFAEMQNSREKKGRVADTIEGWVDASQLTGMAWRCEQFVDRFYNLKDDSGESSAKKRSYSVKPKITMENKAVFELLSLATEFKYVSGREIGDDTFFMLIPKVTTKINSNSSEDTGMEMEPTEDTETDSDCSTDSEDDNESIEDEILPVTRNEVHLSMNAVIFSENSRDQDTSQIGGEDIGDDYNGDADEMTISQNTTRTTADNEDSIINLGGGTRMAKKPLNRLALENIIEKGNKMIEDDKLAESLEGERAFARNEREYQKKIFDHFIQAELNTTTDALSNNEENTNSMNTNTAPSWRSNSRQFFNS